jgi:hypothetical protein
MTKDKDGSGVQTTPDRVNRILMLGMMWMVVTGVLAVTLLGIYFGICLIFWSTPRTSIIGPYLGTIVICISLYIPASLLYAILED